MFERIVLDYLHIILLLILKHSMATLPSDAYNTGMKALHALRAEALEYLNIR